MRVFRSQSSLPWGICSPLTHLHLLVLGCCLSLAQPARGNQEASPKRKYFWVSDGHQHHGATKEQQHISQHRLAHLAIIPKS